MFFALRLSLLAAAQQRGCFLPSAGRAVRSSRLRPLLALADADGSDELTRFHFETVRVFGTNNQGDTFSSSRCQVHGVGWVFKRWEQALRHFQKGSVHGRNCQIAGHKNPLKLGASPCLYWFCSPPAERSTSMTMSVTGYSAMQWRCRRLSGTLPTPQHGRSPWGADIACTRRPRSLSCEQRVDGGRAKRSEYFSS